MPSGFPPCSQIGFILFSNPSSPVQKPPVFYYQKGCGSREPLPFPSVDPLFYLSSFHPYCEQPAEDSAGCSVFSLGDVHNSVELCFQTLYSPFKIIRYLIDRKVAEAVSRFLSAVDPLFYLSSFHSYAENPSPRGGGFFIVSKRANFFRGFF